jgi:hypothetical protein
MSDIHDFPLYTLLAHKVSAFIYYFLIFVHLFFASQYLCAELRVSHFQITTVKSFCDISIFRHIYLLKYYTFTERTSRTAAIFSEPPIFC